MKGKMIRNKLCVLGLVAASVSVGVATPLVVNMSQAEEVQAATNKKKKGWKNENGGWKYYKNGTAYTGWHKMGKAEGEKTEHWSYFGKDGKIYTGWRKMGKAEGEKKEHWSYFGPNGWLRTGWQQMGKGTSNPDGNAAKHWSYFGNNGWLRTGLQDMGKGTQNPDGNSAKHKSYFGGNGWLVVNKQFTVGKTTYKADGRGWCSVYHPENNVFMKYLKKIYNGADAYIGGYPKHNIDDWGSYDDFYYHYLKYAIADFDGDNTNELLIMYDAHAPSGHPIMEIYERNGNSVKSKGLAGLCNERMFYGTNPKFTFYNNGLFTWDNAKFSFKPGILNNTAYNYFSYMESKVIKKLGLSFGGITVYEKSGNKIKRDTFFQDGEQKTISVSQYKNELKFWTSGKKVNVTLKDFTSKNIK